MVKPLNTILYAEDEADIREITKIALEDLGGLQVTYCANGQEALNAAKTFTPDLILLDVMMPNMDGPTLLKKLRELSGFETIPVIFMTAKVQTNEVLQYKAMGAIDVISKPFDPMQLADQLKTLWQKYEESL